MATFVPVTRTATTPLQGFAEADPTSIVQDLAAAADWLNSIDIRIPGSPIETYRRGRDHVWRSDEVYSRNARA